MAAPDYVPTAPAQRVRRYSSPPRRSGSWSGGRPAELTLGQPQSPGMGYQGPDQGFVYKLVGLFDDLHLGSVHRPDADAGCVAVALKRAAHFGRGPVVHDLRVAYTVFGFLDAEADPELVALREQWFAEIGHGHHHAERRALADRVPIETLARTPEQVDAAHGRDWRSLLDLG